MKEILILVLVLVGLNLSFIYLNNLIDDKNKPIFNTGINCNKISSSYDASLVVNESGDTNYNVVNVIPKGINIIKLYLFQCSGVPSWFVLFVQMPTIILLFYLIAVFVHG